MAAVKQIHGAFIEKERCFDTIDRDALRVKQFQAGTSSDVRMVKYIFRNVMSCVKISNGNNV